MALYLKYRPLDFSSLVGQEFIKTTLKAAVAQYKTVGAYLFTGPRGTGKTSTARIFAKSINCISPKDWDPCLECEICKAFASESLIDVIEIDAASHTGVDNIREIIEKAQFRPTQAAYKIYIIDEVHMLSKWAFNALLKILEEPPKHVKFILATTEIHKVPDTILSRCQRYDFKNFTDTEIKGRLEFIAASEWVSVDNESYNYIVKNAEGWMRNAVSLFEQLISDGVISYTHIVETLWVASEDEKKDFIAKLVSRDASLLDDFDTLQQSGKNLKNFFKDILWDIQRDTIVDLKNDNDISGAIMLLENIQDMLIKSKQSFDESMTFKIGLLKIVSGYKKQAPVTQDPKVKTPKTTPVLQTQEKPVEDIVSSAQDIFATDISPDTSNSHNDSNNASSIDISKLVESTKKHGWKAALSMTLKGSTFDIKGDILHITTKTKIALSTLNKTENRDCLFLALGEMGLEISDIKTS